MEDALASSDARYISTPSSMPSQGKRRSTAHDIPVKRFRVSRACDQCRTERSKCDGNQPQCAPCFEGKRTCTYTSNPRKRGLPPGYIRTIELALALVLQQHTDIETSLITKLTQDTILLSKDGKESNRLHKTWRKSKFCKTLNKVLTGEQTEIEEEKDSSSGEDSDADAQGSSLLPTEIPTRPTNITPVSRHPTVPPQLDYRVRPAMQQPIPEIELTQLPADCWRLLENYSVYTQCWLPICEKLDVLKLSYSYPNEGLALSYDMTDGAQHAEMWSMFALGSMQDQPIASANRERQLTSVSRKLYRVAQSLIPDELGKFHLSHVKAILNLAVFNISSSCYDAAWVLVGAASRIVLLIDKSSAASSSRWSHVLASCFLLDNVLSLLLKQRPYLDMAYLERAGKIEEDGLEEWQPWNGEILPGPAQQSRSPILALSSFNRLLEVLHILLDITHHPSTGASTHEALRRLEAWKSALPPSFEYVRSESVAIPLTPPAALLQVAHFATALAIAPSQLWLQRILDLMNGLRDQIGYTRLPSTIICLLESIRKQSTKIQLDQPARSQINRLANEFRLAHFTNPTATPRSIQTPGTVASAASAPRHINTDANFSSPESFHTHFSEPIPARRPTQANPSSLLDDLLPDMNPNQQAQIMQPFDPQSVDIDFTSPGLENYDPSVSGDLDSFFDELASLHGAKKLQNQPQFMENLGFAPEVSMDDLLATQTGQLLPFPPAVGTEHEDSLQFTLNDYYDAG